MHGYVRCAATACWVESARFLADIPVCAEHERRLMVELAANATPVDQQPATWTHLVYYAVPRDDTERIKIGTTVNIHSRMRSLRRPRLLVVEPGSFELEKKRHRQFSAHRQNGEWFRFDSAINAHISWLRRENPLWRQVSDAGHRWD